MDLGGRLPIYIYKIVDENNNNITSLTKGVTYTFDQSHSSNSNFPLLISLTNDGTHNGGSQYSQGWSYTGTAGSSGSKATWTVPSDFPNGTIYFYCADYSGIGNNIVDVTVS